MINVVKQSIYTSLACSNKASPAFIQVWYKDYGFILLFVYFSAFIK